MNAMKTIVKSITLFLIVLWGQASFAQFPVNSKTGGVEFSGIEKLEGLSKEEIYERAKLWMLSNLKSGDNMFELNKNENYLIGSVNLVLDKILISETPLVYADHINLNFKLTFFLKENRYKYKLSNFTLSYGIVGYFSDGLGAQSYAQSINTGLKDIDYGLIFDFEYKKKPEKKEAFSSELKSKVQSAIDSEIDHFKSYMREPNEWDW